MAIIDVCTYNGEADILDLRLNILNDYVDEFIIIEFDKTFSGKKKDWLLKPQDNKKIKYFMIEESQYMKYEHLANSSPNTQGAEHWKREFMQKESIKDCLKNLRNKDILFIGDVDEIWNPLTIRPCADAANAGDTVKIKLDVYTYFLNQKSSEQFWGPIVCRFDSIKDNCLNHMRTIDNDPTRMTYGWHFTSMGGYEEVKRKLEDSYTEETYANGAVMKNLENNIVHSKDFLGRDFKYTIDESDWPRYLKDNKEKYAKILFNGGRKEIEPLAV